jgi:hypothetical protein
MGVLGSEAADVKLEGGGGGWVVGYCCGSG